MKFMLKSITFVLFVILVLGLVVVIRTYRFQSRQIHVQPVPKVRLDEQLALQRFTKALQFETVSYPEPESFEPRPFLDLHAYLEEAFPAVHLTLKREVIAGYSLLYFWQGSDPSLRPILLMSHIDVVPVEPETRGQWTYPPFSGTVADGFIWGRGTLDIKCGALAILEAVEHLLNDGFEPTRGIYLAFGHDEEVGGRNGNARISKILQQRGVRFQYVLDEGGAVAQDIIPGVSSPVAYVGLAEKGYFGLKMTAEGPGGHSSMPQQQTAVGILAEAVSKLEANPLPADLGGVTGQMLDYLGPEMPFSRRLVLANRWLFAPLIKRQFRESPAMNATMRTTTAVTMVGGGVSRNVLPTNAWAVVNFRVMPGQTSAEVLEHVARVVNDERVVLEEHGSTSESSVVSDIDSPAFKLLEQTIREVFPDAVVTPALAVVTTDSRHYEAISENTFRFIPTRLRREDLPRVHGINERIGTENYLEIVRFFIQQIRNSAS